MNDIIHLLPESVANQIAAGEVVQRPSSIVKELVENSIDAGAHDIKILVVDAGRSNVQVIDDGKGMSETDACLAFERHATSKIKTANDLFSLTTMGFRGEALASIAAVAQVELTTKREEDELGTLVQISGSLLEKKEPVVCPVGSNFSVKNLFYNIPARRKFLKSNQTEYRNILHEVERVVLVHPEVSFTLLSNGVEMLNLPPVSVRQRILDVFDKKLNSELLPPINAETSLVSLSGYVAKPESSRKTGCHQFFFVNGRYMRHPYFQSAVMKAYENLIPAGEQISFFIYMSVDPSSIDVNVHPTKTEIKFDNEREIWLLLSATVKEALGKFNNVPMIDFDVEGKPDIPVFGTANNYQPNYSQPKPSSSYNPFKSTSQSSYRNTSEWSNLYDCIDDPASKESMSPSHVGSNDVLEETGLFDSVPVDSAKEDEFTPYIYRDEGSRSVCDSSLTKFQIKGRYIVCPSASGILVVDQRRAHICVLYDQNMSCLKEHGRPVQKMLFPEILSFTHEEIIVLDSIIDDVCNLGFELTSLGGNSYSLSGIPSGMDGVDMGKLLHDIIHNTMDRAGDAVGDLWKSLALTMAKSGAIQYGKTLSLPEMTNILQDLFKLPAFSYTPDGKKVFSIVETSVLDGLF